MDKGTQTSYQDQRLNTVFQIARVLATRDSLDDMLPHFLACLIETQEVADTGLLSLYDPSEGVLKVKAAHGYDLRQLSRLRLAPGESMSGQVYQSGRAQLYPTPEAIAQAMMSTSPTNREAFETAATSGKQPLSAICIPLVTREVGVEGGALVLENLRQPHSFTEDDVTFLEHVADHITLSVENAHLRETLRTTHALDETNRFKGGLISTLAHEMRTPLTSIKGYATALLMEEAAFSPETQREFLKFIDEECDTLQDLIHDLLESTIIDAGLMRLEFQPVLVARLTKDVIHDMALSGEKHRFLIDFPKDFPIVEADPDRITQVLRNLLDNAVKYSPQGGLIIVRGEVAGNEITVSVADQGIGIAPDDLNRLFDKFFRANSRAGRRVVGSGLGLPIVRAIVDSHGGRVWAESHVDQGTTLYFTLPIRNSEQDSVQIAGDAHE